MHSIIISARLFLFGVLSKFYLWMPPLLFDPFDAVGFVNDTIIKRFFCPSLPCVEIAIPTGWAFPAFIALLVFSTIMTYHELRSDVSAEDVRSTLSRLKKYKIVLGGHKSTLSIVLAVLSETFVRNYSHNDLVHAVDSITNDTIGERIVRELTLYKVITGNQDNPYELTELGGRVVLKIIDRLSPKDKELRDTLVSKYVEQNVLTTSPANEGKSYDGDKVGFPALLALYCTQCRQDSENLMAIQNAVLKLRVMAFGLLSKHSKSTKHEELTELRQSFENEMRRLLHAIHLPTRYVVQAPIYMTQCGMLNNDFNPKTFKREVYKDTIQQLNDFRCLLNKVREVVEGFRGVVIEILDAENTEIGKDFATPATKGIWKEANSNLMSLVISINDRQFTCDNLLSYFEIMHTQETNKVSSA